MMRLRIRRKSQGLVCQQVVELVTDYLENRLSRADRRSLDAHLAGCPHCTEYLAQLRATIALTGRITSADLTTPMRAELIEVYRSWQRDRNGR
jgi:anti-sigma factor RsiW